MWKRVISESYKHRNQVGICSRRFYANTQSTNSSTMTLGIIGIPFSKGQSKQGVETAPDFLRKNGLINILNDVSQGNLKVNDYGNLEYEKDTDTKCIINNCKNYPEFMGCNKALIKQVQEILKENDQFLALGGDHAIGFGSVAGHLQHTRNLSLVWIDAHADINLHSTSESGNIHGMPVSFLLQELRIYWENAKLDKIAPVCLPADQLIYIGLRDVDPYEAYILNKLGIRAYAMDSIDKYGIQKIIEMTLDGIKPQNKIHVSFDIDALDKAITPSTGTAVNGGLTLREGIALIEAFRDTKRIQGVDLVELNPLLGTEEDVKTTLNSTLEILKSFYGYKRAGNFSNINTDLFKSN
ncbi:arginase-1 [Teleopsis dalmanni]|uniref:arginase-1 n=1 Tax=Teleopsis dalmanni TaxID=139649 RepID=UPI0018CFC2AD|nr:arginase-1 [Teleopsis dalmanni]